MIRLIQVNPANRSIDLALFIARVSIGLMMLTHGLPKLQMLFSDEPVQFISFLGMGAKTSLALAVFAEVACSVLLIAGFATRIVVIPLIVTMLVAAFMVHINDPFVKQEMSLHYLLVYVLLLLTGSGRYSVDRFLSGVPAVQHSSTNTRSGIRNAA